MRVVVLENNMGKKAGKSSSFFDARKFFILTTSVVGLFSRFLRKWRNTNYRAYNDMNMIVIQLCALIFRTIMTWQQKMLQDNFFKGGKRLLVHATYQQVDPSKDFYAPIAKQTDQQQP